MPDEDNLFNGEPDRHRSWNQNQTRRFRARDKIAEMSRHSARVMRDQDPPQRRCDSKDLRILQPRGNNVLWQLEINIRLAAKNAGYNILIQIGIGKKPDSQTLPRKSFFSRLAQFLGQRLRDRFLCCGHFYG